MMFCFVCVRRIYYRNERIKMLELETLFLLVNILCYTIMAQQDFKKMGKAQFRTFLR